MSLKNSIIGYWIMSKIIGIYLCLLRVTYLGIGAFYVTELYDPTKVEDRFYKLVNEKNKVNT